MPKSRHLRIEGKTVIKSGNPRLIRVEVEKTLRGRRIGLETGLFRVPELLDYDESRGVAVFERLFGIESLINTARWGREYEALAERIGASLAAIHGGLSLPADMIVPVPEDFGAEGNDVFLHGDYGVKNICLDRADSSLVILDWQFTDAHGGEASYGSRYFDVIWFVNNLLWVPTTSHLFRDPVGPVARRFVESYFRAADLPYDAEGISRYAEHFFEIKKPERRKMSRRRYIYLPRCHALTRRFVRSLREDICRE